MIPFPYDVMIDYSEAAQAAWIEYSQADLSLESEIGDIHFKSDNFLSDLGDKDDEN